MQILGYNHLYIKIPGMFDNPVILNLHLLLWDSYIADWMSSRHYAAEGRREVAVTHLALLGVKIAGNGILGYFPD